MDDSVNFPENIPSLRYLVSPASFIQGEIDKLHNRLLKINEHLQHLYEIASKSQAHIGSSKSITPSNTGSQSNIFSLSTSSTDWDNHAVNTDIERPRSPAGLGSDLHECRQQYDVVAFAFFQMADLPWYRAVYQLLDVRDGVLSVEKQCAALMKDIATTTYYFTTMSMSSESANSKANIAALKAVALQCQQPGFQPAVTANIGKGGKGSFTSAAWSEAHATQAALGISSVISHRVTQGLLARHAQQVGVRPIAA